LTEEHRHSGGAKKEICIHEKGSSRILGNARKVLGGGELRSPHLGKGGGREARKKELFVARARPIYKKTRFVSGVDDHRGGQTMVENRRKGTYPQEVKTRGGESEELGKMEEDCCKKRAKMGLGLQDKTNRRGAFKTA